MEPIQQDSLPLPLRERAGVRGKRGSASKNSLAPADSHPLTPHRYAAGPPLPRGERDLSAAPLVLGARVMSHDISRASFLRLLAGAGAAVTVGPPALAASPMARRSVPKTGVLVPVVGVGTARSWDVGKRPSDRAAHGEILRLLFQLSFFNTPPRRLLLLDHHGNINSIVNLLTSLTSGSYSVHLMCQFWTVVLTFRIKKPPDEGRFFYYNSFLNAFLIIPWWEC